jgi:hypothetical protein
MRGPVAAVALVAASACEEVIVANDRTPSTNALMMSVRTSFLFIDIFSFTVIDVVKSIILLFIVNACQISIVDVWALMNMKETGAIVCGGGSIMVR